MIEKLRGVFPLFSIIVFTIVSWWCTRTVGTLTLYNMVLGTKQNAGGVETLSITAHYNGDIKNYVIYL